MDAVIFLVFAIIAVVCAINVVVQTHPISSAISLVGVMGSLAVLYLLLGAEFLAAAQVIVYAGAVMVLFVFVIMLIGPRNDTVNPRAWIGPGILCAILLAELPSLDIGEMTDKGSINQRAVLANRSALVEDLYADPPPAQVIVA